MTTNIFTNPPATGTYTNYNTSPLQNIQIPPPSPTPLPYIPNQNIPPMSPADMWNQMQRMQQEIDSLKANQTTGIQLADIEKQLSGTQKGREYLRLKQEGAVGILIKWALQNPMISQEMQKFLDGWKDKASEYLNNLEASKKNQTQGSDK